MSELEKAVDPSRRSFIKRLVVAGAFAVPVVSSFTMMGSQAVFGSTTRVAGAANSNTTTRPDHDDEDDDDRDPDEQPTVAQEAPAAAQSISAAPKFTG